ncbi:MAG: LL-diaminopimelate aminotransferase [Prevotella sp.]|jgi:LL-diaminopimelate aminotransferase|uniref:LL-diaminopimelate aminotransferase n=1 Tax=Segatella cerevisiae TaxID=2053716 RepID=A0ABT1BXU8_9BACT|nr:LL-diaminopimelate aminotransferase [Segatella cerevisiae]MCH3995176.1 LL-diaminopimelate aminotransferase [Prevotella sp.]MCI1246050.1 LL-diaminopimelate aminotransferase [Prevotella sp.]MCO6025277.1 LL-diaminopimelate aminotransferase [Segatella cerevisiae]
MALVNENFLKLPGNYLFADIAKKVNAYKVSHPKQRVISLGIGDVTRPLCPAVIEAMHKAVEEMAHKETFRGYGPERGYDFLREAVAKNDFALRGIHIDPSEIFINDGAKSDTGNFQDILQRDNTIGVTDPIYPVYIDSNVMAGRAGELRNGSWSDITYMPCTQENNFIPQIPDHRVDMVYLCYPNNPTGTVLKKEELKMWVDYALKNDSLILYDAAYEAFIREEDVPHSIYEIRGAKKCAVEFHSYSKTAGFTGVRCGYTVVPKEVTTTTEDGKQRVALNQIWMRRQSTKFNGTSYISQRAAEAIYTKEGKRQTRETIDYYLENARIMREALTQLGFTVYGGVNAPYLWVKTPDNTPGWKFFDQLLFGASVVCTPGVGFGPSGEGYIRLTSFGEREDVEEAMQRISDCMKLGKCNK